MINNKGISNAEEIRKAIDTKGDSVYISPPKQNSLKKSNFNDVLARLASKNNVRIGFDINYIKTLEKKDKASILSYIRQVLKILRKSRTKLAIPNKETSFLFLSLGASTKQI